MWLEGPPSIIDSSLYQDLLYYDTLNLLYRENNIYIMDNHLAAGFAWLRELDPEQSYNFFHIDRHPDLLGWGKEHVEFIKNNPNMSLQEYLDIKQVNGEMKPKFFMWDTYIYNIYDIYPNWFKECFFACEEEIEEERPFGQSINIIKNINFRNNPEDKIFEEVAKTELKWIINIDVDYFCETNEQGEYSLVMSDSRIEQFCDNLISALNNISVITIALSPSCCGGWKNAYYITKIITDKLGLNFSLENIC